MFGMGMGELIVILIVALLVLGPTKLPDAAKAIGKGIRELRKHTTDLQQTLENDETIGGSIRELKGALRGDEPSPSIRPAHPTARKPVPLPQEIPPPAAPAVAEAGAPAPALMPAPMPVAGGEAVAATDPFAPVAVSEKNEKV